MIITAGASYALDSETPETALPDNGLPVVVIEIDETKGHTIEDMNKSPDHSVECIGSMRIIVPDGFRYCDLDISPESLGPVPLEYIRGRGNSTWKAAKKPYRIKLKNKADVFGLVAKADLTLSKTKYAYTGKKRTPAVDVKIGGVTLVQGQDYNVTYRNNINVGTASALITPASANYAGSKTEDFVIVKGKTSFKVKASRKKVKVTHLSKGSSKVRYSVKKVTNGQKSKVKINSKTGKLTLKKKIRKCTIYVKVTSKANKNRKARTKTVKIVVR